MQRSKIHLKAREAQPENSQGQALGACYNFGLVSTDIKKVTCKNCLKRYEQRQLKSR